MVGTLSCLDCEFYTIIENCDRGCLIPDVQCAESEVPLMSIYWCSARSDHMPLLKFQHDLEAGRDVRRLSNM